MDTGKWLAGPQEISGNAGASPARPKMFCFPHAGGGASFYRNWERNLRGLADVRAVQLPGREERFREPRYYSIHRLADALFEAEEGRGWFDGACILFGHSMGAKIAFEVARRLVLQGRPPALLLVSGSRPVHMPPRKLLSDLPDEAFDAELRQLAGTRAGSHAHVPAAAAGGFRHGRKLCLRCLPGCAPVRLFRGRR